MIPAPLTQQPPPPHPQATLAGQTGRIGFGESRHRLRRTHLITATWIVIMGAGAFGAAWTSDQKATFQQEWMALLGTITVLMGLFVVPMGFLFSSMRRDISLSLNEATYLKSMLYMGALSASYPIYGLFTNTFTFENLGKIIGFVTIPFILCRASEISQGKRAPSQRGGPTVFDMLAVASIWLPFNFGFMNGIWVWPAGEAAYILNTPLAMSVALINFQSVRRLTPLYFRFNLKRSHLTTILTCLAAFMLVALPIGFSTGFLAWNPRLDLGKVLLAPLGIFFFIALPEELLFRGVVFGIIFGTLRKSRLGKIFSKEKDPGFLASNQTVYLSLAISSLLFGFSHWHDFGPPPWTYIGLATYAGAFYGYTYYKTSSLAAAALLHTLVDTLWELFFHV